MLSQIRATGASSAKIAEVFGVTRRTVRKALRDPNSEAASRLLSAVANKMDDSGTESLGSQFVSLDADGRKQQAKRHVQQVRDQWLDATEEHRHALQISVADQLILQSMEAEFHVCSSALLKFIHNGNKPEGDEYTTLRNNTAAAYLAHEIARKQLEASDAHVFVIYDKMCKIADEAKKLGVFSVYNPRVKGVRSMAEQHRQRCKSRKAAKKAHERPTDAILREDLSKMPKAV